MTPAGVVSTVGSFSATSGGYARRVLVGQDGALYGTTDSGPSNLFGYGTVFRMTPAGALSTLFTLPADGHLGRDIWDLAQAGDSSLWGVAQGEVVRQTDDLDGQIFNLSLAGAYRIVHSFTRGGPEGSQPCRYLTIDPTSVLYGCNATDGRHAGGTAFSMTPDGALTVVYGFGGNPALAHPNGNLTSASDGTSYGCLPGSNAPGNRHGAIYLLSPLC
jgi:uncharacterized repeat protein (TIGR03803 family)